MEIIEFIGLPGSGKTSSINEVNCYLKQKNNQVYSFKDIPVNYFSNLLSFYNLTLLRHTIPKKFQEKLYRKIYHLFRINKRFEIEFIEKHQDLVGFIKWYTGKRNIPRDHKDLINIWFHNLFSNHEASINIFKDNSSIVVDEGFVQRLITLFISSNEKYPHQKHIDNYLGLKPKQDIIIHVRADKQQCLERLKKRGFTNRLKGLTSNEIYSFLNNAEKLIDYIIHQHKLSGNRFFEIDNSNNVFRSSGIQTQIELNAHFFKANYRSI